MKQVWKRRSSRTLTILLTGILVLMAAFGVLSGGDQAVPQNPIQGIAKESSLVKLTGTREVVTSVPEGLPAKAEVIPQEEKAEETGSGTGEDENPQEKDSKSQGKTDSAGSTDSGREAEASGAGSQGQAESEGQGAGESEQKKKNSKKLSKKGKKETPWFTTSIIDGETVTESGYSFTITHKNKNVSVRQVTITVNGETLEYTGGVTLKEGSNQIQVTVTYRNQKGEDVTASRTYTVYLEISRIQIYTDIRDEDTVMQESYGFTAYAMLRGEELPVSVFLNGSPLTGEGQQFQAALAPGRNEIRIQAEGSGQQETGVYIITYEKQVTELTLDTDLKNQEVTVPDFSFYAKGYRGSREVPVTVSCNGELLEETENGNYSAALQEGDNEILLSAEDGGETYQETYTVRYVRTIDQGQGGEYSPDNPKITCDLGENGSILENIYSRVITFSVNAKDCNGEWISQENIEVTCNGIRASWMFSNLDMHTYQAALEEGYNTIKIRVWDAEGREALSSYSLNYTDQQGGIIGQITLSMEATTVGSGYLIPPGTVVDIYDGDTVATVLERVKGDFGFDTRITGSVESDYYLARVITDSDFVTGQIPEDLEAHLLQINEEEIAAGREQIYFPEEEITPRNLGEFDFSVGSGWMYSVNGIYPNVSMAGRTLQSGDEVRIRFTLYYGADIGGGSAMGNNGSAKEESVGDWEREW